MTVEQARKRFIKDVLIELDADVLKQDNKINQLHTVLSKYRGGDCPVKIKLTLPGASSALLLPDEWHIKPEDALLTDLHNALPEQQGFIRY